ncbi:MAG: hypothetical protein DHS20C21_13240 [Gemmatimonadota bacterium]|nr:MAG: hypothetical protein DHS20C21_13240 [Gemmatimonadota bacterium]
MVPVGRLLPAAALWVALGTALGTVGCAGSLPSSDGESASAPRVLPARWCGRHILVTALAAGDSARTLTMILDTGSTHNVVDPAALRRIGIDEGDVGSTVRMASLDVGALRLSNVPLWVQELDLVSRTIGAPVDGILGYPTFRSTVLTLDYPAKEVRVTPSAAPMPRAETVLRLKGGRRRPWVELRVGDRTQTVLIDSGSGKGFSLSGDRLRWHTEPASVGVLTGFRGLEPLEVGRLADDIVVGAVRFERPIVRRVDDGIPLIGAEVLRHFVVTIDGPRDRIRFAPEASADARGGAEAGADTEVRADAEALARAQASADTEPSASGQRDSEPQVTIPPEPLRGFGVGWKPTAAGMEVVFLMPGGAGERGGLELGDRVVAVNGRAVLAPDRCESSFDPERSAEWTVVRGEDRFRVFVAPEDLVPGIW